MGCDIHGWVERKVYDKWVAVRELEDTDRLYKRFAALAGVRGCGPNAKGIPNDVSDTTVYHINECGVDGHNHSYLSLKEAHYIFKETICGEHKSYSYWFAFGLDEDTAVLSQPDWRLVFWFDN